MRFMVMVRATKRSEANEMPSEEMLAKMGKFNEELSKAGVLLDLSGLKSSAHGARLKFSGGGKPQVLDGPFPETKELIAGYWILQTKSLEECVEWMKRCPNPYDGDEGYVEIRPFFELGDFEMSDATKATHERVGAALPKH